jgi:hypothetical protein
LAASWRAGPSGLAVTAGRQTAAELSRVSIFDGVLLRIVRPRWAAGIFSGTQPDARDFGYATEIREHGAFIRSNFGEGGVGRYALIGGIVGSYHSGTIDREYAFLQWRGDGSRLSTDLYQQLDLNRGWKRRAGQGPVTASNTYVFSRLRLTDLLSVEGAFDGRQAVRVYRYRETPETQFDDTYRRGVWAGVTQRIGRRFQLGARARVSSVGSSEQLHTFTLTSSASWPVLGSLRARWRSTSYDNRWTRGWMHSLNLGWAVGARLSFDLTQGCRLERSGEPTSDESYWSEANLNLGLGRHWSATGSAESTYGRESDVWTYFSGLRYRL